jgi:shikimate dehydrogenase
VGLLGNPVKHSYGYHIHNFAFKTSGLNYLYLNFLVNDLIKFFDFYREMFIGLSVTLPYKTSIIPFLDEVSDNAKLIGAVNTVQKFGKKLYGHNTDSAGFGYALSKHSGMTNKNIVVLGAGGAARAIVVELLERKNNITILNRTLAKAKKLAKEFNCQYGSIDDIKSCAPNILINCTSVGMYPNINESPIGNTKLKNCLVFDTIYNPYYTKLLKDAIKNGNKVISGFDMFLKQAELQYLLFTSSDFNFCKYKKRFLKNCGIL